MVCIMQCDYSTLYRDYSAIPVGLGVVFQRRIKSPVGHKLPTPLIQNKCTLHYAKLRVTITLYSRIINSSNYI